MENEDDELRELVREAETGDPFAQNLLAARLATGNGVVKDILGSLYWYFEAIKKGYVHAKWNAGSVLVEEKDVSGHRELGMKLIEEAAEAGENSACLFIAECCRNGSYGKKRDQEAASYWEQRAWDHERMKEIDIRRSSPDGQALGLKRPVLQPKHS